MSGNVLVRRSGASKCRQRLSTTTDVCLARLWRCTVFNQGVSGHPLLNSLRYTSPGSFSALFCSIQYMYVTVKHDIFLCVRACVCVCVILNAAGHKRCRGALCERLLNHFTQNVRISSCIVGHRKAHPTTHTHTHTLTYIWKQNIHYVEHSQTVALSTAALCSDNPFSDSDNGHPHNSDIRTAP